MKRDWLVIDEDANRIVTTIFGTLEEAQNKLEELKDAREPGSADYWNTWTIYGRAAA